MLKNKRKTGLQAAVFMALLLLTAFTVFWAYTKQIVDESIWLVGLFCVVPLVISMLALGWQWATKRSIKALLGENWLLRVLLGAVLGACLAAILYTGAIHTMRYIPLVMLACIVSFFALSYSVLPMYALAGLVAVIQGLNGYRHRYDILSATIYTCYIMAVVSLALWLVFQKRYAVAQTLAQRVGFWAVAAAATFLYCYNAFVVVPTEVWLQRQDVAYILLLWVLCGAVGLVLMFGISMLSQWLARHQRPLNNTHRKSLMLRWAGLFLIMAAVWLVWWTAFRPGNMSSDSIYQWGQATGRWPLNNSHPYLGTLWIGVFANVWPTPALYTLAQVLLMAALYATLLLWWYKKGLPFSMCACTAAAIALMPAIGVHATMVWKDIPFGMAMLWMAFLFARLALGEKPDIKFAVETSLVLMVVACFRHNGIVISMLCAAAFLLVAMRTKAKALAAGALAGLALYLFITIPLAGLLQVRKYDMGLSGLAVSTMGTAFYYDADIPPDIEAEALTYASREEWIENYNPYHYFGYFNAGASAENPFIKPYYQSGSLHIIGNWFRLFVKNPLLMLNERMAMCDSVLFVNQGLHPNAHSNSFDLGIFENDYGFEQTPSLLYDTVHSFMMSSSGNTLAKSILWRPGVWLILCLWLVYYNICKRQSLRNLYFLPMAANVLSLLVAVTEQGFRYIYVIGPYALIGIVLAAFGTVGEDGKKAPAKSD